MPNFSPNSIIRIGRVPFDNSYRHTMTFASASAQTTYFTSVCTQALSQSDYTYVRVNNSIRVPFNAESLYTYNYVMYQNKNYGTKWFYAFIVGVNYVNENMTELVLELDVMQTWYFDYTLKECFVEREHVNDDTIGAHLNPEPSIELKYIRSHYNQHDCGADYIVLYTNALPHYRAQGLQTVVSGSDPASGGKYQNFFSGCMPILFNNDTNGVSAFKKFVDDMNKAGAAESITDIFTIPSGSVPGTPNSWVTVQCWRTLGDLEPDQITLDYTYTLSQDVEIETVPILMHKPTTINGYVPKNNKLFTHPYTYCEVGDFSGRVQDYFWEYFEDNEDNEVEFDTRYAGISDHVGYVTPALYYGIQNVTLTDIDPSPDPFTFNFANKISWTYSQYQNWMAQNAVTNQLAVMGGIGAMVAGFVPGVTAYIGAEKQMHSLFGAGNAIPENAVVRNAAVMGGAMGVANTVANIARMRRVPNTAKGNTEGNSKFQTGYAGWYSCEMSIRPEFARIIDDFLSMYGYQVDIVKVPNREGRTKWNYVKTQNACFYGNVPADMMAKINFIYDSGITFWHTSDIGNYSAANTIVT